MGVCRSLRRREGRETEKAGIYMLSEKHRGRRKKGREMEKQKSGDREREGDPDRCVYMNMLQIYGERHIHTYTKTN